jgi:hypothetical protein
MMRGELKRVKWEKPILDNEGKPVLDPNTGQVMYEREFEPAQGQYAPWMFKLKNIHGWRDRKELSISDPSGKVLSPRNLTREQVQARMEQIALGIMERRKLLLNASPAESIPEVREEHSEGRDGEGTS